MLWLSVLVAVLLALGFVTLIVAVRGLALAPNRYQPGRPQRVAKRRTSEANCLVAR